MYDFNEICCVCLKVAKRNRLPLSTEESDNVSYLIKLEECAQKELKPNKHMQICRNCIKQLNTTHEFIKTLLQAVDVWSDSKRHFKNELSTDDDEKIDIMDDLILKMETNEYVDMFSEKSDTSWINSASFYCSMCIKNFPTEDELLNHACPKLKRTIDSPKTQFYCKLCNLSYDKRYDLIKHRQIHQQHRSDTDVEIDEKKYVCTFCGKSFKQSYHLREHITSHTGEKNFSCPICMKKFQRMSSQRRHMRTHQAPPGQKTKKTPFLCTICGKTFPYSNGAQRHMRTHQGVRRYECPTCGKKFSQSTHLHVHQRTHTGEKPYICDMCGDAFALNATLQKHRENHRKNDVKMGRDGTGLSF